MGCCLIDYEVEVVWSSELGLELLWTGDIELRFGEGLSDADLRIGRQRGRANWMRDHQQRLT